MNQERKSNLAVEDSDEGVFGKTKRNANVIMEDNAKDVSRQSILIRCRAYSIECISKHGVECHSEENIK